MHKWNVWAKPDMGTETKEQPDSVSATEAKEKGQVVQETSAHKNIRHQNALAELQFTVKKNWERQKIAKGKQKSAYIDLRQGTSVKKKITKSTGCLEKGFAI